MTSLCLYDMKSCAFKYGHTTMYENRTAIEVANINTQSNTGIGWFSLKTLNRRETKNDVGRTMVDNHH